MLQNAVSLGIKPSIFMSSHSSCYSGRSILLVLCRSHLRRCLLFNGVPFEFCHVVLALSAGHDPGVCLTLSAHRALFLGGILSDPLMNAVLFSPFQVSD